VVVMLSEEIAEKELHIAVRLTKLTATVILKAINKLIEELEKLSPKEKTDGLKHGRQTLKQLSKHNDGLTSIELTQPDLRLLNRHMKKHGIDFAAVKDGKGKYMLFFKGRDIDSVTHAFKKYTAKNLGRGRGQSITDKLATAKKEALAINAGRDREKNKSKGAIGR
jgi:predicted DNA-binding protein